MDDSRSYSFDILVTPAISQLNPSSSSPSKIDASKSTQSNKKTGKIKITEVKAKFKIESISKTGLVTIKL